MRLAWRSFQAVIRRSASSSTWASVARRAADFFLGDLLALILHLATIEAHSFSPSVIKSPSFLAGSGRL